MKKPNPTNKRILELEAEVSALRAESRDNLKKLEALKKKSAIFQAIAEEVKSVVKPLTPLPAQKVCKKGHTEDVVMHLSDEHFDEIVLPETVQNLENYNFTIACARAEKYVNTVLELTQSTLSSYSFENLWILAYGDHTSGELHGGVQRSAYKNMFKNVLAGGQLHALMFRDLAPYFKNIHCVYVPGNHGRRTPKKDYHGAHDNWDYLLAEVAKLHCRDIKNVHFTIPNSFAVNVNIRNHVFAVEHGDDVQSWNSIPYYGLERKSRRLSALHANQGLNIHCNVYGHFHQPSMLSGLAGTETIINGSWKATDPFVYGKFSGYTVPHQWLHGVHDKQGITWRYRINLLGSETPERYIIA